MSVIIGKINKFSNGTTDPINLLNYVDYSSYSSRSTTYAFGNTRIQLINADAGTVRLFSDKFDWDYHSKWSRKGSGAWWQRGKRDFLIANERALKGLNNSHGYPIYTYGTGTIKF